MCIKDNKLCKQTQHMRIPNTAVFLSTADIIVTIVLIEFSTPICETGRYELYYNNIVIRGVWGSEGAGFTVGRFFFRTLS